LPDQDSNDRIDSGVWPYEYFIRHHQINVRNIMPYPAHLAKLLAMQPPGAGPAPGQQYPGRVLKDTSITVSPRTLSPNAEYPGYPGSWERAIAGDEILPIFTYEDLTPRRNSLRRYGEIMDDDDAQSALLPENDTTLGAFIDRGQWRQKGELAKEWRKMAKFKNKAFYKGPPISNEPLQPSPPISNEPLQPSPLVRNVPFRPSPAPMGVVDQRMPPKRAIPFDRMQMNRSY
jgi:hypothetical protein